MEAKFFYYYYTKKPLFSPSPRTAITQVRLRPVTLLLRKVP